MKKLTLVKYDYDAMPEEWKVNNINPFAGVVFCYLGDIPNMKGHSYVQDIESGKGYCLDTDSLIKLKKSEV